MSKRESPKIDPVAFDNPFGEMAKDLDPYTEGSMQGVMVTLLSAYSGYLGHTTRVQTGRGTSPLATWFVLVGLSGKGRKGATARIAMPVIKKAFNKWASEHVLHGIPATGLGMMAELNEHDGNSVFVLEEEMDTFINNAKKDTKVGVYLRKAWDGETITHKTAKADFKLENPHLGFVGHVQPKNWGAISGSKDATGGTYNRFLAIYVEQSKRVPVFGGPDPADAIEQAAKRLRGIAAWGREVEVVSVPADVARRFEEHHRPACESLTEGSEELAEMAERALAYMIRIAALYALASRREEISVEDLDSALALVTYAVESVRYVLPDLAGESLAQKILTALETYGTLSSSELWDVVGRNRSRSEIQEALRLIPQVEVFKGQSTGGRPPTFFRLVTNREDDEELELVS